MIKLKHLIKEQNSEKIDLDKLFDNDRYLESVASSMGYDNDFTKVFWSQQHLPVLYHCTTKENYEKIKANGLKLMNIRRGAVSGNRHIGPAVFTTQYEEEVSFFKSYYGPMVIGINTNLMKHDGFTPGVSKEPDWARAEMLEFVLKKLGQEDAEAGMYVDSSDQNTQGTVIIHSSVPPKYLSFEMV